MEELKSALRNTEYKKMTSSETKRYRREFNKIKNSLIDEWENKLVKMANLYRRCHFRENRKNLKKKENLMMLII